MRFVLLDIGVNSQLNLCVDDVLTNLSLCFYTCISRRVRRLSILYFHHDMGLWKDDHAPPFQTAQ